MAQSDAHAELAALAEALGAPVYDETVPSRVNFPSAHPLYAGPLTRLAASVHETLSAHDLVVSIGADVFTLSVPGKMEPLPVGMPVVHLDSDPWELGKNYAADVAIQGEPKATLRIWTPHCCARWRGRAGGARQRGVRTFGRRWRRVWRSCARRRRR